jgi:hypothetical protein
MADVFGFNSRDAEDLIASIGGGDRTERLNFGGGGGDSHFNFQTTGTMLSYAATASLYEISDFAIVIATVTVVGSLIFGDLPVGTRGICVLRGGAYHIIQAACPPEEEYL